MAEAPAGTPLVKFLNKNIISYRTKNNSTININNFHV